MALVAETTEGELVAAGQVVPNPSRPRTVLRAWVRSGWELLRPALFEHLEAARQNDADYEQTCVEHEMHHSLADPADVPWPDLPGLTLQRAERELSPALHAAYQEAFRTRPGYDRWAQDHATWSHGWLSDDDYAPGHSWLARVDAALCVATNNPEAQRVYENLGFRVVRTEYRASPRRRRAGSTRSPASEVSCSSPIPAAASFSSSRWAAD